MRRRRLVWQLYPPMLIVILGALAAAVWYSGHILKEVYVDRTRSELESRARLVEAVISEIDVDRERNRVDAVCKDLGARSSTRITVILASGRVAGDSNEDPSTMEDHGHRPEIVAAFSGGTGVSTRFSHTRGTHMMYVAVPLRHAGVIAGVVRASVPLTAIDDKLRSTYLDLTLGGAAIAVLAAALSLAISKRISRPLEEMRAGAEAFARGELGRRLAVLGSYETAGLAEAMNEMASQLDARIRTITRERNEHEAILSSMVEGVLAVDPDERVISANDAAASMLGLERSAAQGRSVQELVRNAELQAFISRAARSEEPVEGEIALEAGGLYLQARGAALKDSGGNRRGAVIVLSNITRLRQLENIRREFVANVSHELRTPITTIKGFIETLLDGAAADRENAERFLRIALKQVDRLSAIVEDLLLLSRVEEEGEKKAIPLERSSLREPLAAAVEYCEIKARGRDVSVDLSCPEDLSCPMNGPLLEQVVVNLIDNAIKYSNRGGRVRVSASPDGGEVVISVSDDGIGIPEKHLSRIFERFYTVDKTRSRELGGTGLGLSIVKHITAVHGGNVTVESAPGKGSTFLLHLPA